LAVAHAQIPDFTAGMWVGERALLSTTVRRTWTVTAREMTALMSVPSAQFAELLHRLGLEERFRTFVDEQVIHGLCGRCGDLGDHFTHACPLAEFPHHVHKGRPETFYGTVVSRITSLFDTGKRDNYPNMRRPSEDVVPHNTSSELYAVLRAHRLNKLAPALHQQGVQTSADLLALSEEALAELVGDDEALRARVAMLRASLGDQAINPDHFRRQHLIFLSHYKLEAGTEAALVRHEIETIFKEQTGGPAEVFEVPVFLDSEDLNDLEDLQQRVCNSHNVVVLLTKNVFARPWVLIEVVTARRAGVRTLPIEVHKPGDRFEFPDDDFYSSMLNGGVLGAEGEKMLKSQGIELAEVVDALAELLKKIAMPYSPHRSASIRHAEVMAVLKQCRFKTKADKLLSVLTKLPSGAAHSGEHHEELVGHKRSKGFFGGIVGMAPPRISSASDLNGRTGCSLVQNRTSSH